MKAVWILSGILLFLLLLCAIPLSVRFRLGKAFCMEVRICGFRVLTFPPPVTTSVDLRDFTYKRHKKRLRKEARKAARKKKKEEQAAQKKSTAPANRKKPEIATAHETESENTMDRLREMMPFLHAVLDTVPKFFGRMECNITRLHVTAGGEDAAQAAIHFGMLSQSAAYLLEVLDCRTRLAPLAENALIVRVDYTLPETVYDVDFTLNIRMGSVLHTGVDFLTSWIRRQNKA